MTECTIRCTLATTIIPSSAPVAALWLLKVMLHLNGVTTETEANISENCLHASIKEFCHLWARKSFTPSIKSSLLLEQHDHNQLFWQTNTYFLGALEYPQLYVDMHWRKGALHRVSAFHAFCSELPYAATFSVLRYISGVIMIPFVVWIPQSALIPCHRKQH